MKWILGFAFCLSGITGLVYEIAWGRMLSTLIGSTIVASSVVMAVFMAGLAIGAWLFGFWGDKYRHPLRLYAILEALIAFSSIVVSLALVQIEHYLPRGLFPTGLMESALFKIGVAGATLLVPTIFMGGTLPILSRYLVTETKRLGQSIGFLYGLNTLGAFIGCIICGFYAIEALGLMLTLELSAAINLLISSCFLFLSFKLDDIPQHVDQRFVRSHNKEGATRVDPQPRGFLLVYAASGATALAYEVFWTRLLSNAFIGTSYGFATMLAVSLGAMALGSLFFKKRADITACPLIWFALMQIGIAIWAWTLLLVYTAFPSFENRLATYFQTSLGSQIIELSAFSMLLIFAPALLFGALFPLANRIASPQENAIGHNVGKLYFFNTIGCVIGSLSAGLLLLPQLGIQTSLVLLGSINCALGFYCVWVSQITRVAKRGLAITMAGTFVVISFLTPPDLLAKTVQERLQKPWILLKYYEGTDNNVMVLEQQNSSVRRLMTTFYQYIGDTSLIMKRIQKLQAYLPILIKGDAEKILFVGLGTGITPAAATDFADDITAIEISPSVLQASQYFATDNKDILQNPRVKLVQEDGRQYLMQSSRQYDLIIGDLYNAALAGMGNLYSRDYYELCFKRLEQDGMMAQWVSMKDLPEPALKGIMATFGAVFPHSSLWFASPDILVMVGSKIPMQADMKKIYTRMKQTSIKEQLQEVGLYSPFSLLGHFLMNQQAWNRYVAGAAIITDNRPYIEYSIPRSLHYLRYAESMPTTLRHVNAARSELVPDGKKSLNAFERRLKKVSNSQSHLYLGYAHYLERNSDLAHEEYQYAAQMDPWNLDARLLDGLVSRLNASN